MIPPYPQGTQSVPGMLSPGTAPIGPPAVRPRAYLGPPGGIVNAPVPQRPSGSPLGPPRPMGPPRPVMGALGPPRHSQTTAVAGGPRPGAPQNGIGPRPTAPVRPMLNGPPQRPALSQNGLHTGPSGPHVGPFRPPSGPASQNSLPAAQAAAGPPFPGNAPPPRPLVGGMPGIAPPPQRPHIPMMAAAGNGPLPQPPLAATGPLPPPGPRPHPHFPGPPLTNGSQGPPPPNGFPSSSSSSVRPMHAAMPPAMPPPSFNGPQQPQLQPGMAPPPMTNGPAVAQPPLQPPLPPPPTASQQNGMEGAAPLQPQPPLPPTSSAPRSHYPPMPQPQPQPQRPLPPQPDAADGAYGNRFQSAFSSTVSWQYFFALEPLLCSMTSR